MQSFIRLTVVLLLTASTSIGQAEEGWSIGKLWPFHKQASTDVKPMNRNTKQSKVPMTLARPMDLKQSSRRRRPKREQASVWSRLVASPRKAWEKTSAVLSPGGKTTDKKSKRRSTAREQARGFATPVSWFTRAKDEKANTGKKQGPATVTEWLSQPRLDP